MPVPKPERFKFLDQESIRTLLDGPRLAGRHRDYYLLSIAYYLALRGGEAVAMRAENIDVEGGEAWIASEKRKVKKGARVCKYTGRPLIKIPILFGDKVLRAAIDWSRGNDSEWMFPSRGNPDKPISTRQYRLTFHLWSKAAGLDKRVSAHSLRHSAGTHVNQVAGQKIRAHGGDPLTLIRDFMRHSSVLTTSIYLHTDPSIIRSARSAMRGAG